MMRIFFLFSILGVSWLLGADNSDIIWTWGNSKLVASIFSWTYFVLGIDTIQVMVKYTAVIGATLIFLRELGKGDAFDPAVVMVKVLFYMGITYGISIMFLEVRQDDTHRVYVVSANELADPTWAKCRPVNGDDNCYAPTGVKMIVSAITNFERASIQMMEKSMMDANAMTYSFSQMGLGFGFTFFDHIAKNVDDAYAYNTFMDYYENCILYDLSDGTKSVDDLYKSNDLATYILSPNSRLTNVYSKAKPQGELQTCYAVSSSALWGSINCNNTASEVKGKMSGTPAAETTTDDICLAAQNFGQLMFNTTKDATAQIEQQTIMNLTNESIVNSAIASGMDPTTLAYGTAMADREQTAKWTTMGVMAKEWIPTGRGIMQSVAIGLIWILALFAIATASPMEYIGAVVGYQATLMVWSVLLAILNYATISIAADQASTTFMSVLGSGDQMTLWSQPTHHEQFQKAQAFLGYMALLSYGIAVSLVGKAATKLGSIGNGISQLAVGMGTSANMAKGQFDHGFDKSDASGTQAVNHRDGGIDRYNPDGAKDHRNLDGVNSNTSTDGAGTISTKQSVNGKSTTSMETTGGNKTSYDGTNVTGTELKSGTMGAIQDVAQTAATQERIKAVQESEKAGESKQHAIANQTNMATDAIKTASTSDGTDFTATKQEAEKRAFSKTLDEMVANKEIDSKTAEKASQLYAKAQIEGRVGFDTDKQLGTKILGMATGFSASLTTSGAAGWQGTTTDKDAHQTALEKSFADKMSKNYTREASNILANSSNVSQSSKDDFSSKFTDAQTQTDSTSKNYEHSLQVAQTATEKEQYVKTHGASVSQDIAQKYLQNVADQAGGGDAGMQAVKAELNRLENSRYASSTFREIADKNVHGDLGVHQEINNASSAIQNSGQSLPGGSSKQSKETNDDKVREQAMLNESDAKSQTRYVDPLKGRVEH